MQTPKEGVARGSTFGAMIKGVTSRENINASNVDYDIGGAKSEVGRNMKFKNPIKNITTKKIVLEPYKKIHNLKQRRYRMFQNCFYFINILLVLQLLFALFIFTYYKTYNIVLL